MNVVFRVDASSRLGAGYLWRCLALADRLRASGASCLFLLRILEEEFGSLVEAHGHQQQEIPDPEPQWQHDLGADDLRSTFQAAKDFNADWLVVDNYWARDSYLETLSEGPWRVAVIDDLNDREMFGVSLVVNATVGSGEWDYPIGSDCRLLAGPQYALLRSTFSQRRQEALLQRQAEQEFRKVLICIGGAHSAEITEAIIAQATGKLKDAQIRAVVGRGHQLANTDHLPANVLFLSGQTEAQMADLMAWADLAIATPSTVAWELACMVTPTIIVRTEDNQTAFAKSLSQKYPLCLVCEEIAALSLQLRRTQSEDAGYRRKRNERWASLCDGLGAERVAAEMMKKAK
jgi:UDP-2,4-diacetamido-2,4,6-trideoxy-beta-L-altropyranose hydrolase